MSFSDVADDLEALYYASLWFEDRAGGMPAVDVEVSRYKMGSMGPTFKAEKGTMEFGVSVGGNRTGVRL